MCVSECPNLKNKTSNGLTDVQTLVTYSGVWQPSGGSPELPIDFIKVGDYSNASDAKSCTDSTCYPDVSNPKSSWTSFSGVNRGLGYAFYASSTYKALWRCFVTDSAEKSLEEQLGGEVVGAGDVVALAGVKGLEDSYKFLNRLFADLWAARDYVLGFGLGASFAISLVYIFLLRVPLLLTGIVWGSIAVSIAMFFVGGAYAWMVASSWREEDPRSVSDKTIKITTAGSIGLFVVGGILVLLAVLLRRSIQLAILCVREAGKAVTSMIIILLVPFLQAVGFSIFIVVFCVYAVYLASLGDMKILEIIPGVKYRVFEFDETVQRFGWYLLFCFFWTSNFIVAVGDMIIAIAVAKWYFARNKLTIGSWTVISSIFATFLYHLGTCAYGSLIIACIQFIRAIIAKAQKHAKETKNKILEYLLCCCQCCFWCLEKCMKFINKNAYIQTAIFSTPFCKSCRKSFWLIFRNISRVGAVTYVSAAVLIVGKLFISTVTTAVGYIMLVEHLNQELFSVAGPLGVIFLISYFISDFFMDVFDMGISTVLHCFIAEEEMFDGRQRYADSSLKNYVDKYGKDSG